MDHVGGTCKQNNKANYIMQQTNKTNNQFQQTYKYPNLTQLLLNYFHMLETESAAKSSDILVVDSRMLAVL